MIAKMDQDDDVVLEDDKEVANDAKDIQDDIDKKSTTSTIIPAETKSKDKGKGILVEEAKPLKKQQQIEQDEKYARELEAKLNKNIDWDEAIDHIDYFKGMSYDDIRPIFERYFDSNMAFLQKTKEQIKEEVSRALKRINETPAERAAKRQKLDEEVEELKRHLQIVPNEDDDVYTDATPLARKVPVVDYEVINMNNKPYYKIIRADGTHQLYIITFTTTQLILLVKRKYPLTRFTLDQMLNAVRLEVEEESEVSLELLRNMIMYLKNVVGFRLDYFKGMSYDDIPKKRKLNEEVEDLKQHLEIVPNEDDDVYTEATPLARKRRLGVIIELSQKRFSTSKPNNFSDDLLLTTLGAMFERPNRQAQVWKSQRTVHGQAKVKSWKLLESCGVHIITFTTTQLILLVKRRYPLSRFTLDQMLNAVRLRVEEQSEISLELLSFTRKQHQEGQLE
nr:hypothetical protein [Tanacetum cinerariifolium]